jgi:hypothetical protein
MTNWSKRWVYIAIGFISLSALLSFFLPSGYALNAFADLSQTAILFGCYLSTLPNQTKSRGRAAGFWMLMGIGFALWLIAQGLWACYEVMLRKHVPDPFIGDIVLFMHVVPMLSALALQPHRTNERTLGVGLANAALMFVWFLSMYLYFVIPWQYVSPNKDIYDVAFDHMYAFGNLSFVTTAGVLWLQSSGEWKRFYTHWFAAGAMYAVGSYMASRAISADVYYSGSFYDLLLSGAMLWYIGAGFIGLETSGQREAISTAQVPVGVDGETWLSVAAVVSVFFIGTWGSFGSNAPADVRNFRFLTTCVATVILGIVIVLKQQLLRKADREGVSFVSAAQ